MHLALNVPVVLVLVRLLLGLVDLHEGLFDQGPDPDDDVGAKQVHRAQSKKKDGETMRHEKSAEK